MPYLNDSSAIIQTYTSVYFHAVKTAKKTMQIEPGIPVTSRLTNVPNN